MLVLTRKTSETIQVTTSDGVIIVTLVRIEGFARAKIGITAPKECKIIRPEAGSRRKP